MTTVLLLIIYLAFISLGLPDSLLGSAWPVMYGALNVPVSWAGIISMIIAGGTILSSLMSDRLIHKFGTGVVTLVSVAMTALALFGFSISSAFWMLCLWGIPYGLGAGSVDAALNNFVALHFKSRHMSWLHCFWGIGATVVVYYGILPDRRSHLECRLPDNRIYPDRACGNPGFFAAALETERSIIKNFRNSS